MNENQKEIILSLCKTKNLESDNLIDLLITIYERKDDKSFLFLSKRDFISFSLELEGYFYQLGFLLTGIYNFSAEYCSVYLDKYDQASKAREEFLKVVEKAEKTLANISELDIEKIISISPKEGNIFLQHAEVLSEMLNISRDELYHLTLKSFLALKFLKEISSLNAYIRK